MVHSLHNLEWHTVCIPLARYTYHSFARVSPCIGYVHSICKVSKATNAMAIAKLAGAVAALKLTNVPPPASYAGLRENLLSRPESSRVTFVQKTKFAFKHSFCQLQECLYEQIQKAY